MAKGSGKPATPKREPYDKATAKKLARDAIENGFFSTCDHSRKEMQHDQLTTGDVQNVIRAGWVEFEEEVDGTWRYRFTTNRICVVVTFPEPNRIRVVTTWRNQ